MDVEWIQYKLGLQFWYSVEINENAEQCIIVIWGKLLDASEVSLDFDVGHSPRMKNSDAIAWDAIVGMYDGLEQTGNHFDQGWDGKVDNIQAMLTHQDDMKNRCNKQ